MLERLFHLSHNQTTVQRELLGGLTTFLTMSYIIFVQPIMLQSCGMDFGAVMVATCVASAISIFIMGFLTNYPIALAPGMGHNVFLPSLSVARWDSANGSGDGFHFRLTLCPSQSGKVSPDGYGYDTYNH